MGSNRAGDVNGIDQIVLAIVDDEKYPVAPAKK